MVSPQAFPSSSRLRWTFLLCACLAASLPGLHAQELPAKIYLQGNQTPQEGRITGIQGDAILFTVPNGRTSVPLAQVVRVEAVAPPSYATGMVAYHSGNYDQALADLRPVGEGFRGLPLDWAQQTLAALGSIYLEKNDVAKAEAAFNDYRRYYPNAPGNKLQLGVAQARIAFAKNNASQARQALDTITQAALKAPAETTPGDGAAYGQAFYLLARLQERENNLQGALENYLRVVTLFYQDAALAVRAQKGADDLRTAHKGLSVP